MTAPIPFGVRYLRVRLDGDLGDLHKALAYLAADTCDRGRCGSGGGAVCGKHQRRLRQRQNGHDAP